MRITDDNIMEGLLVAHKLLNIRRIYFNDLREICEQHASYEERTAAARERFSSPRFNEKLDRINTV